MSVLLKVIFLMDAENVSSSGYLVPDDNNTNADEALKTFMSDAKKYIIYKIGKFILFLILQFENWKV